MALSRLSLNQSNNQSSTSSNIPSWIDTNANESVDIHLLIDSDCAYEAMYAVKTSKLPHEVITYLTADNNPVKMFTKAGFGIGRTSGVDNAILEAFAFIEVLGVYTKNFLNIIAPYVYPNSYIRFMTDDGLYYDWKFYDSICYKVYLK